MPCIYEKTSNAIKTPLTAGLQNIYRMKKYHSKLCDNNGGLTNLAPIQQVIRTINNSSFIFSIKTNIIFYWEKNKFATIVRDRSKKKCPQLLSAGSALKTFPKVRDDLGSDKVKALADRYLCIYRYEIYVYYVFSIKFRALFSVFYFGITETFLWFFS